MAIPKPPLPDAPPLPHAPPLPDLPTTAPLPVVTAGRSGLPPFMSRLKAKRGKVARAPLAPIASRAAEKGERQREAIETAKAVKQATTTPSNVTPIRPEVKPEPAPKSPSKAGQMRDALHEVFGKRTAGRMAGMSAPAHEIMRQYAALHGRHIVGEYHQAGTARARELLDAARAAHQKPGPVNAGVKQAATEAATAHRGETIPEGALDREAMRHHVEMIRKTEQEKQASGQKVIRTDLEGE